jgi:hypothetical protein
MVDIEVSEICRLHGEIIEAGRTVLAKAIRIGEILTETKANLPHGQFTPWLKKLPFAETTARNYMRLFRNRAELKTATVAGLTEAYKTLAAGNQDKLPSHTLSSRDEEFKAFWITGMVEAFNLIPKGYQQGVHDVFSMAIDRPMEEAHSRLLDSICELKTRRGRENMRPFFDRISQLVDEMERRFPNQ